MSEYSYNLNSNMVTRSRKSPSRVFIVLVIFFLFAIPLSIIRLVSQQESFEKSEAAKTTQNSQPTAIQDSDHNKTEKENVKGYTTAELLTRLEKEIEDTTGTYSIYIYDIGKKIEYGINEQTIFAAASVSKVAILATLYHLAGSGNIDLEKIVVPQTNDIQDYGSGSIRYDPARTPYSLKTLARLMMEKSDNTAAYILGTHILGIAKIQELVDSWGLTQTDMTENKTSAKDMATLLIKMYKGDITNQALTYEMLGFMDKSDYDDRIPAGLPEGVKVYHKTGDEIGQIHDVGIVDLPNHPYFLGILTIDMTNDETTKRKQAQISKLVYEYMSNL